MSPSRRTGWTPALLLWRLVVEDGTAVPRWFYVCMYALHGKQKVWLSKPGGVSGSVGCCMYVLLYPVSVWQGWPMLRCTMYRTYRVRGCRFGICMYSYVCVCIKCLWFVGSVGRAWSWVDDGSESMGSLTALHLTVSAMRFVRASVVSNVE